MNGLPKLKPTGATDETYGGVTYHIGGELVPVLSVDVSRQSVYFEHHILLWKNSNVKIGLRSMKGALKRMMAGMQIFVTEASGNGVIAFSRDGAGHIVPIHLARGEELHVREHQFLAATASVDYSFERVRGISNMLFGQSGFFIDKFRGETGDGVLWLHGYGNVFEKELAEGETIDIEPGGWLYKTPAVKMETVVDRLSSGLFGAGMNFIVNRFTGPGRVGIQSMYVNYDSSDK
ncbi:AIM24 family protein [Paraburkholderia denitrificans]|uniref:AIM24 family protein n=2 Tax=Paraburkholderia denitrificans TaxID=694025 RepID=A0ABW0J9I9_9BURK